MEKTLSLGISISFDESVRKRIVEEAFDTFSGARKLRRVIRRLIENPLSEKILEGKIRDGDIITVNLTNGKFSFEKQFEKQTLC
jgi:ATP-dependent Clp protease ATP-binding subunit ClpA